MERAQWGYTINDALRAQIPDLYNTKEMQKEKANWKHKLEQARKEVRLNNSSATEARQKIRQQRKPTTATTIVSKDRFQS